jgi:hypothetical protein
VPGKGGWPITAVSIVIGQFEEALFTINGATARAANSGVELHLLELLRIKSQVFAARHDRDSAMNCLIEALAVARAHSALAWELRSTMVLARLLSESAARSGPAYVALVHDRFTEAFETADLQAGARGPRGFAIAILAGWI